MDENPQYEKKRWRHFGACAFNVFLVLTTGAFLSNSNGISPFSEYKPYNLVPEKSVLLYLIVGIGIECIGMFGAFFEQSCLTITYICIYIVKITYIFFLFNGWWYTFGIVIFFYVLSLITSILFLASLSQDLQRRQMNSPEQSTFQQLPGQYSDYVFSPLPICYSHHTQPLADDPNPGLVINVTDTTADSATTSEPITTTKQ